MFSVSFIIILWGYPGYPQGPCMSLVGCLLQKHFPETGLLECCHFLIPEGFGEAIWLPWAISPQQKQLKWDAKNLTDLQQLSLHYVVNPLISQLYPTYFFIAMNYLYWCSKCGDVGLNPSTFEDPTTLKEIFFTWYGSHFLTGAMLRRKLKGLCHGSPVQFV